MQRRGVVVLVLVALLAGIVTGCGGAQPAPPDTPIPDSPTAPGVRHVSAPGQVAQRHVALDPAAAQATPVVQSTPEKAVVSIWWPDELWPESNTDAATILNSQFELFRLTYASYDIDLRRKRTAGMGGILSTLRAAAPVAPGAMPDLTLLRRSDMLTAAREGLIVPLDEWMPADLAGANLFPGTRALGEVNGELYGIPYALVLHHAVYRLSMFEEPPLTFDAVIEAGTPYLFAGSASPVSWTALLQYIAAGGRLVDETGNAALNPDALAAVLDYYARGVQVGVFDASLLEYDAPGDYWNAFVTGEANIVSVNSRDYLAHKDTVQNIGLMPVPTPSGLSLTMLDGWVWVVTTQNPDRQQRALAFLAWMMRVGQQSAFTEAFGVVPSQTRALALWDDEAYADFAQALITTAIVFPEERRNNAAAAALQQAVTVVLKGASPDVAANEALAALTQ